MERKLEILKDSNCGAFCSDRLLPFFLITFCLWTEWKPDRTTLCLLALGFCMVQGIERPFRCQFPFVPNQWIVDDVFQCGGKTAGLHGF